jgi:hypothetical protein
MLGAAKLSVGTFEDVSGDRGATQQAAAVVVVVSIATGIGFGDDILELFKRPVIGLAAWGAWTLVVYIIGTKLLGTAEVHASWGQIARVLGFAQSPGMLRALGWIPLVGEPLVILSALWQLIAVLFALSHVLDYKSTWRLLIVAVLTVIPYGVFIFL